MPPLGDLGPVVLLRGALLRKLVECLLDGGERDADALRCADESEPPEDVPVVSALVARVPTAEDQPFTFVEMEGGGRDSAALRHLADGELVGGLETGRHDVTIVLDLNFG